MFRPIFGCADWTQALALDGQWDECWRLAAVGAAVFEPGMLIDQAYLRTNDDAVLRIVICYCSIGCRLSLIPSTGLVAVTLSRQLRRNCHRCQENNSAREGGRRVGREGGRAKLCRANCCWTRQSCRTDPRERPLVLAFGQFRMSVRAQCVAIARCFGRSLFGS